ncbi:MAG: thioesterase family protein [Bacillota bacterium]
METIIEIPVRSNEVDFLGHVNNAKYLEYMEWGREDWYKKADNSFDQLAEKNIGTATVNINIDYLGECYRGDLLLIKTVPVKVGNCSFVMSQQIFKKHSGEKVTDAHVTTVTFDMDTRKSISVPPDLREKLEVKQI